jgi:hypothetical protein
MPILHQLASVLQASRDYNKSRTLFDAHRRIAIVATHEVLRRGVVRPVDTRQCQRMSHP